MKGTVFLVGALSSSLSSAAGSRRNGATGATNVLYLVADDMRADLGCYGRPALTPHLDGLAGRGTRFSRAYSQISVCAPSRMSFMTGRRPDTFDVWNFIDVVPSNTTSIPSFFRSQGYLTLGAGKLWHQNMGAWNAANCWSPEGLPYVPYGNGECPNGGEGGGHCVKPEASIEDYDIWTNASAYLSTAASIYRSKGQPFLLMVGFRKPHAPFETTQDAFDRYDNVTIEAARWNNWTSNNRTGSPLCAWSNELAVKMENGTAFGFGPYYPVPAYAAVDQRRAYWASLSYVDDLVGRLVAQLENENLTDSTLVVFHADHGYLLGEHGYWEKKSVNTSLLAPNPSVLAPNPSEPYDLIYLLRAGCSFSLRQAPPPSVGPARR